MDSRRLRQFVIDIRLAARIIVLHGKQVEITAYARSRRTILAEMTGPRPRARGLLRASNFLILIGVILFVHSLVRSTRHLVGSGPPSRTVRFTARDEGGLGVIILFLGLGCHRWENQALANNEKRRPTERRIPRTNDRADLGAGRKLFGRGGGGADSGRVGSAGEVEGSRVFGGIEKVW